MFCGAYFLFQIIFVLLKKGEGRWPLPSSPPWLRTCVLKLWIWVPFHEFYTKSLWHMVQSEVWGHIGSMKWKSFLSKDLCGFVGGICCPWKVSHIFRTLTSEKGHTAGTSVSAGLPKTNHLLSFELIVLPLYHTSNTHNILTPIF